MRVTSDGGAAIACMLGDRRAASEEGKELPFTGALSAAHSPIVALVDGVTDQGGRYEI